MIKEFQGEYRWLSNFAPATIGLDGIKYPSVEHAYMSAKSDSEHWKKFCSDSSNTAGTVKKASRVIELVENWEHIKVSVMQECIEQKFSQEPYKSKLLSTGYTHIQEGNTWNDTFWGVNLKTGKGENNLGKIIMQVRTDLTYIC